VAFNESDFLSRVTAISAESPVPPRSARVISALVDTRCPLTAVITSPALIPAVAAAEPLVTALTSTPSCTPK